MMLHPRDDLAAFALGALEPDEARAVRVHLDGCEECTADIRALEESAFAIAATSEREVPARLREAIVERAHDDRRATPRSRELASFLDALRRPVPFAVPVALGILLVISLAAYLGARNDSDRYARALSGIAGARVVTLAPTGEVAGVRGSLVIPADGAAPYLILDLPAPPSGKTWEAWILRGETPLAAGITNERGMTTLVLTAPLISGDGVALTLEPSGGVDRVTGAPVLAGKI
jgi:anti-sigma factor RsiW